jgi:histidinol-phosphate aminotransferase
MAHLVAAFRRLGLVHVPSAANFVLVRVGDGGACTTRSSAAASSWPDGRVRLSEHVRITVGTPAENARLVDALAAVLA